MSRDTPSSAALTLILIQTHQSRARDRQLALIGAAGPNYGKEAPRSLGEALALGCPLIGYGCPSKYTLDAVKKDRKRLIEFSELRGDGTELSEAQQAEEAHVWLRYRVYRASPEAIACHRLNVLEGTERAFKEQQFLGKRPVKRLSRRERSDLKLLRRLYSQPREKRMPDEDAAFLGTFDYHPFRDELPSSNGYFYPPHSKVGGKVW